MKLGMKAYEELFFLKKWAYAETIFIEGLPMSIRKIESMSKTDLGQLECDSQKKSWD